MFEANLKKVTGAMFNIFAQSLTQEANDKIHAERKRKKDLGDPKRDQCKMREVQVGKLGNVLQDLICRYRSP